VAALAIAAARPAMIVSVASSEATIIMAIDVSGSMCSTDIAPTRIQAAEAAATRFIEAQGPRTRIGIVAFSGFAALIQPPTSDRQTLIDALRSLTTGRRTAIGSGILAAIDAIAEIDPRVAPSVIAGRPGVEPAPVPQGDYAPEIIVVLTDGVTNAGPDPIDAAQQATDRGIRVYTIGFGTANGAGLEAQCAQQFLGREPGAGGFGGGGFGGGGFGGGQGGFRRGIDDAALTQVAQATGGAYYPAESADQLEQVLAALPTSQITEHDVEEITVVFVGLGIALAGIALLLWRAWRPLP
jgi:Ca-activated chloride channel family protein